MGAIITARGVPRAAQYFGRDATTVSIRRGGKERKISKPLFYLLKMYFWLCFFLSWSFISSTVVVSSVTKKQTLTQRPQFGTLLLLRFLPPGRSLLDGQAGPRGLTAYLLSTNADSP